MGCLGSKDEAAEPLTRKYSDAGAPPPSGQKYQAPEIVPAKKASEASVGSQPQAASLPRASLPPRPSGNAALLATSTDRRIQEVEFFRNIVKRTEEYVEMALHALHCL